MDLALQFSYVNKRSQSLVGNNISFLLKALTALVGKFFKNKQNFSKIKKIIKLNLLYYFSNQ
jgi:hypothetical protein